MLKSKDAKLQNNLSIRPVATILVYTQTIENERKEF